MSDYTFDRSDMSDKITFLKGFSLGITDDDVVANIFGRKILGKKETRQVLELSRLDADLTDISTDPRSAWGLVQGLTRLSQVPVWGDERARLARAGDAIFALAK